MKILNSIHNRFILIGICPSNSRKPTIKLQNIALLVTCLIINLVSVIASVLFILKNLKSDLENSLHAAITSTATMSSFYTLITAFILRHDISNMFIGFKDFYDKYKDIDSEKEMQKANKLSTLIAKYGDLFLGMCLVNIIIMSCVSLVYSYFVYDYLDLDILYRPLRWLLPWNQNTLSGWIIEVIYSVIGSGACIFSAMPFAILFISFFFFHRAFQQIYKLQLQNLNLITQSTPFQSYKLKKLLFETVVIHILMKDLFQQTAHVYGTLILVFLINSIIFVASSVFQMDLAVRHLDLTIIIMIFALAYGLPQLYAYCYFGKRSTDCYLAFADYLYQSNWMVLPVKLQRTFILMIAYAQRPVYYHGYHVVIFDLTLFGKTIKTIISYYLMFKTFSDQ